MLRLTQPDDVVRHGKPSSVAQDHELVRLLGLSRLQGRPKLIISWYPSFRQLKRLRVLSVLCSRQPEGVVCSVILLYMTEASTYLHNGLPRPRRRKSRHVTENPKLRLWRAVCPFLHIIDLSVHLTSLQVPAP